MKQVQSGGTLPQQENKGFQLRGQQSSTQKKSARGLYWGEVVLRFQRRRLYKSKVQI